MGLTILALESSGGTCSIAVYIEDGAAIKIASKEFIEHSRHTLVYLPLIDEVLKEAQIDIAAVNVIAVSVGPGSFTGIRLAVAIAKAVAFTLNIPIVPISSLAGCAFGLFKRQPEINNIIVVNDAKMNELYVGGYRLNREGGLEELFPDTLCNLAALPQLPKEEFVVTGSAATLLAQDLGSHLRNYRFTLIDSKQAQALDIALLAVIAFKQGKYVTADSLHPVYLRNNVVNNA